MTEIEFEDVEPTTAQDPDDRDPEDKQTRVYRYGLLPPIEAGPIVREQMRAAHRYQNTLVEIERARRAQVREVMLLHGNLPELEATAEKARAALEVSLQRVKLARSKTRSKNESAQLRQEVADGRSVLRAAVAAVREQRRVVREDAGIVARIAAIEAEAGAKLRAARAACGVFWGTYLLVEDAHNQSRKMPLHDGLEANDPRFRRFTGQGRVGVQIQGGITKPELESCEDTALRIEHVGPVWHKERTRTPRGAPRAQHVLWMRIGSEGRAPKWARWPLVLHRPIPDGAIIRRATVMLTRVSMKESWSLAVTVVEPEREKACGEGTAAIDVGWRVVPTGLRVAVAIGDDGVRHEMVLTEWWMGGMRKATELAGLRADKLNVALAALRNKLAAMASPPDWLVEQTEYIAQWRSASRLAALLNRWREARFEGDSAAFEPLQHFITGDKHLWQWEAGLRAKTLLHRRQLYRDFAAMLTKRYGTIVLEDFDLRKLARRPALESTTAENETARRNRQWASLSELRLTLKNAMLGRGGQIAIVSGVDSTRTCNNCGLIEPFDSASEIRHECSGCGVAWDQDENAGLVLLQRFRERPGDAKIMGGARKGQKASGSPEVKEGRWVRARRLAAEKRAKIEAARESPGNGA